MSRSWPLVPLGDLASSDDSAIAIGPFGSRMKADNYTEAGVSVVRGQNLTDSGRVEGNFVYVSENFAKEMGSSNLNENDIVLPHRGAIGRAALVPAGKYLMSTSLMRIRVDGSKVLPKFALYYLLSAAGRAEILKFASTVGTPGIGQPLTSLRQVRLPLPPLDEQRRIAGVLGALDDLIEVNRGLMRDLDSLGMALFQSAWDGNSWTPSSSLGSVIMGQSPPGSTYNENGFGTVFFQGVRDFGDRYPRSRVRCTAPTRVADQGDILIAVRAPIGETNVAVERTAIGRGLAALKAEQPALSLRAVRASERTWAAHQGTGTVFSSISGPDLRSAQVPLVDDPALEAQLATLDAMHSALAEEIDQLSWTRDELLPLLMSGRVRVAEGVVA